jgi:outer membrane protein assembly factor BamB
MTRARVWRGVLAVVLLAAAAGCDWTQLRHDFGWSGYNPTEQGVTPDGPAELQPVWTYNLRATGSPVTGGGRVYVDGRPSAASSISHLFAVRESDGSTLWAVPCHQGAWHLWVYAEGAVFAQCGTTLHALDAATGAPRWQRSLPVSFAWVHLAGDGLVVVASTTGGSTVTRLGLDGTERWSLDVDSAVTVRGTSTRMYVERADGTIAVNRLDDGGLVRVLPDAPGRLQVVAGGRLFFVQEGGVDGIPSDEVRLRAVDADTGQQLWEHRDWCSAGTRAGMQIAVSDDAVAYVTDNGRNGGTCVYGALDVATGARRWTVPAHVGTWGAVPTIADGVVYYYRGVDFGTDGGVFAALRMADGEVLLEERVTRDSGAEVVVANGRVLLPEGAFTWVPTGG